MYNLNQKQKIIIGIFIFIVAGFLFYYVYARGDNTEEQIELQNTAETEDEEYSDEVILIHVSGAVNKEGIVELKINSRIADAIEQAGGFREDASTEDINLAYKLEDGMKIYIPTKQEKEQQKQQQNQEQGQTQEEQQKGDNTENYVTTSSGIFADEQNSNANQEQNSQNSKVNINTATQTQLETLPGIGPATATKILEYRKEKGKFNSIEDIKEVSGIGDAKFEKIKDYITVK